MRDTMQSIVGLDAEHCPDEVSFSLDFDHDSFPQKLGPFSIARVPNPHPVSSTPMTLPTKDAVWNSRGGVALRNKRLLALMSIIVQMK